MIINQGDRFVDPSTKKRYVVTELVFDGDYVILKEIDGDSDILMSQENLKAWNEDE